MAGPRPTRLGLVPNRCLSNSYYIHNTPKVMTKPHPNLILIGGSSHVGKSAVSKALAATLGWDHVSTDSLARHPGRPWKLAPEKVPDHVARHYLSLSVDELVEDVLHHYRVNVWPQVEKIIASRSNDTSTAGIVLEGSALWPELATSLDFDKVAAVWLTAKEEDLSAENPRRKPVQLEAFPGTEIDRQISSTYSRLQRTDGRRREPAWLHPSRCSAIRRGGACQQVPLSARN